MLIVSAPSGSGKSTIVQWLMKEHPELNLYFSISCTSRPPRGTEQHGVEYFFLTEEEFRQRIDHNEFLEYEEVYAGRFYGTLKSQVEKQLEAGQNVVFDVDVKGGVNIKKYYGSRAMSLFIQPPSVEELRRRLEGRGTDSPEAIENRLAKAEYEMTFAPQFDRVVVNDDLETAKRQTLDVVSSFLKSNKSFCYFMYLSPYNSSLVWISPFFANCYSTSTIVFIRRTLLIIAPLFYTCIYTIKSCVIIHIVYLT